MDPPLPTPMLPEGHDTNPHIRSLNDIPRPHPVDEPMSFPRFPSALSPPRQPSSKRKLITTESNDVSPDSALGQFSFAPATQTTVVTTTTTTTTRFPPFEMRAPRCMHELDPKIYPLAFTPTPASIRDICFDFEGRPTFFHEAKDTTSAVDQLKQQHRALEAANGSIRSIKKFEPRYDASFTQSPDSRVLRNASNIAPAVRERPVSPVSISEAAEAVRQKRSFRRDACLSGEPIPPQSLTQSLVEKRSQSFSHLRELMGPATPETDNGQVNSTGKRRGRRRMNHGNISHNPGLDQSPFLRNGEQQNTPQTLNAKQSAGNSSRFSCAEQTPVAERHSGLLTGDMSSTDFSEALVTSSSGNFGTTPPSQGDERGVMPASFTRRGRTSILPRLPALDSAAAQDMSLPSPSLSPVTAAANLQNNVGYFEESEDLGTDLESSFQLPSRSQNDLAGSENLSRDIDGHTKPANGVAVFKAGGGSATNQNQPAPSITDIPMMLDYFEAIPDELKSYVIYQLLRRCPKPALHFVADVVNPALKCDFLGLLPLELTLNVLKYLDVKSMCRASQVSKKWRHIINSDEKAWKELFDRDSFTLPDGELQRAVVEGWGWQHPHGADGWEQDISSSVALKSDSEWSSTSNSAMRRATLNYQTPASSSVTTSGRRPKRKATTKTSSRKQLKRKDILADTPEKLESIDWMNNLSASEGPYAAANAAALAVPYPNVGLPSLKSLHLYKSLYQRHYAVRKSWMQDDVKPRHIAFRAHDRHVVTCLQFDTDKILTGSDDTNINVYDTKTGALRARLQGHEGGVWALQYEGNVLVSGSTDRSVRVWDIEKARCMQVFHGHTSTVRCLQILMPTEVGKTYDGKPVMKPKEPLIITGSRDSQLRVWKLPELGDNVYFQAGPPPDDADCPYFVRVLQGHQHSVRAIAAHADTLVSGSYDCTVRVWKISTGETLHRLQGHTQKVYSVVLDYERNRCISGSMDNLVKIWSLDTGSVLFNLEGHSSLVGLLDLNCDRLVSAAADSTLRIWDPENGQCKSTLSAHTGAITCFQHDGQKVISGSDRTLKMWNVRTGECVKDLLTHLTGVWQVKFNERRCVAAVQRENLTYIEVLDFGASRDGVPEDKRGRRIVVNTRGQETDDSANSIIELDGAVDD